MHRSIRTSEEREAFRLAAAEAIKREPTEEEELLWPHLKELGFETQISLWSTRYQKGWIADFAHLKKRIIVEVDGPQHKRTTDARRDRKIWTDLQLITLRFTNKQVRNRLPWVLSQIQELIDR